MVDHKDLLREAAATAWTDLAKEAGLDSEKFTMQFLSLRREGGEGGRIAAKLASAGECYVLKMRSGRTRKQFDRSITAHTQAAQALRGVKGLNAPAILAISTEHRAMLLQFCAGHTAWDLLAETGRDQDHVAALTAVGRWMSAFHRAQACEPVPFVPDGPLNALLQVSQAKSYPAPDRFGALMTSLTELGNSLRGAPVPQALIHGDLTLSNLLIDGDDVTAIDFENDSPAPVARDLAMVLADYSVWFGQQDRPKAGQILIPAKHHAFWSGYGDKSQDNSLLVFFVGLRLLRMWAAVPADQSRHTPHRAHVWKGVSLAASRLLGPDA